jgi:hypothetical protein
MTIHAVWITDTLTLKPAIEHAAARLNTQFVIVSEVATLPNAPIDLLIWSPTRFDRAEYEQIRLRCLHMVVCIPKGVELPRWYPRYDSRWPSYLVVIPFDEDEFATILEFAIQGPLLAPFEPERDDPSVL